jgi:hypothetical protein
MASNRSGKAAYKGWLLFVGVAKAAVDDSGLHKSFGFANQVSCSDLLRLSVGTFSAKSVK